MKRNFSSLSIDGTVLHCDTVIVDGGNILYASVIGSESKVKSFEKALEKNKITYLDLTRKHYRASQSKYNIIKKKIPNSDYVHMIIKEKDYTKRIEIKDNEDDYLYNCILLGRNMEEIHDILFDKIYSLTPVPVLKEWMPILLSRLLYEKHVYEINPITIHENNDLLCYKLNIKKTQLMYFVSILISRQEISINDTHDKSEIIDFVQGLDSYLNIFGEMLADRIQNSFSPKFNPQEDDFSRNVNNYDDSCFHNGVELYRAQKATIEASCRNLDENNSVLVIGEMGVGKTIIGAGIAYSHYGKKAGMTNIVMCPSHLVFKWKSEIEKYVPNSKAYIVRDIDDLFAIEHKIFAKAKSEHSYIILSKENAKFSYELRPAVNYSVSKKTFVCPCCGQKLQKKVKVQLSRKKEFVYEDFELTDMLKQKAYNSYCENKITKFNKEKGTFETVACGAPLWGPLNKDEKHDWVKLGSSGWVMVRHMDQIFKDLNEKEILTKNEEEILSKLIDAINSREEGTLFKGLKAPRKYSLARYIRENYKGHIDYFIGDEIHLYKSGSSKQGQAMADIAGAANKFIGLTGTLLNGYADGLFYILYRCVPQLMLKNGFRYSDEGDFMREYGVIKKEHTYALNTDRKLSSSEKRLPGVSPLVFTKFLLENAVFISLSDMDGGLPGYKEIPIALNMDDELKEKYSNLEKKFRQYITPGDETGAKILGSMLQTLSIYPDMPYDLPPIRHPETNKVLIIPESLEKKPRAKEEKFLELVKSKVEAGEKVLVYYEWTNKSDTGEKLSKILKENNIRSAILTSSVSAETREEWIDKKLKSGIEVLLCNPKLVETGLDLLDFTTIIFYQVGYNIFTMRQASRRSWRLSQTKDIEVYFMYYKGTVQDSALSLMATKLQASMAIEGKFSEEGLRAMSDNTDLLTQIANSVVEGMKDTVEINTFTNIEKKDRERDFSRKRVSLESLKITKPSVYKPAFLKRAINKKTSSSNNALKSYLDLSNNIGNIF